MCACADVWRDDVREVREWCQNNREATIGKVGNCRQLPIHQLNWAKSERRATPPPAQRREGGEMGREGGRERERETDKGWSHG